MYDTLKEIGANEAVAKINPYKGQVFLSFCKDGYGYYQIPLQGIYLGVSALRNPLLPHSVDYEDLIKRTSKFLLATELPPHAYDASLHVSLGGPSQMFELHLQDEGDKELWVYSLVEMFLSSDKLLDGLISKSIIDLAFTERSKDSMPERQSFRLSSYCQLLGEAFSLAIRDDLLTFDKLPKNFQEDFLKFKTLEAQARKAVEGFDADDFLNELPE